MPIVGVAGLGIVMAALLAALLIYGLSLFAKAAGYLLPDWHIPGLGNIRDAVVNGANAAFQAAVGWFDQAVGPVGNWLRAPFHALEYLYDVAISTVQSIYNALQRLGVFVVQAYLAAIKYAAEVATGVARMAITLYYRAIKYAAEVATGVARMAISLFYRAEALARDLYRAAVTYAAEVATQVARMAIDLFGRAEALARTLYHDAVTYADQAATGAARLAITLYERAEADLARATRAAEAYAAAQAAAAARALQGVITTDIVTPTEQAWVDIRDEAAAIGSALATDLPDVRALADRIAAADIADIAAAVGAGALVDTLVMRYLRECGVQQCKGLHDLARDLPNLFAFAEGAAFLAFLAAAIDDPAGTATETHAVLDGLVVDTTAAAARLLGAA